MQVAQTTRVLRAILKAAAMWPVGRVPGGPAAYHAITCGLLGSQSFHPRKLARVWPRYAALMRDSCDRDPEGARVWAHECGWTPFTALAAYLLTGRGAVLTNTHARVLDRYVRVSFDVAVAMELPDKAAARGRRDALVELGGHRGARCIVAATGGAIHDRVDVAQLPLESASIDVCHTGNALEHYAPDVLRRFLRESFRVLAPGGIASHVIDHRDHLHHVDRRWPFLAHAALPDALYDGLFGHPLLFHNRLSPTETMALFADAGFERIAVRRATRDCVYVTDVELESAAAGLPPRMRRGRAARWSELDLRTAYGHYLYRKPAARVTRAVA